MKLCIAVNAAGVSQTCVNDVSNCGFSPGKETVEFLATDNDVFVEEFIVAFTKMIEKVRRSMSGKIVLPKVHIQCFIDDSIKGI